MSSSKILFSIYTGEYPNQSSGGPNNIIYKLLQNQNNGNFRFDFLSSDLFAENLTSKNLNHIQNKLSPKKKIASNYSGKSKLYRRIFGSDLYLPYHFRKKNKYFNSFSEKKINYDIIHSQDSISLSLIAGKDNHSKKMMTVHSKGPLSDEIRNMMNNKNLRDNIDLKLKEIELANIEMADIITFPSYAAKKYFQDSLNVDLKNKKVRIINNGIDIENIQKIEDDKILEKFSIEKKNNQLLLLNVATHTSEKNIDLLLKVVETIKNKIGKDVLLINIGAEGFITPYLKKLVKQYGIENEVKFLGKLDNTDTVKFLKTTDILVMTSEKVIFDLVVLEALACGTCCVVSNEGGNKEIIEDGQNGYLIEINDIDNIAEKIISIDVENVESKALATAKQYSVQKMVNNYFEIYESLLNGI